jgi:hypothetical protein
MQAFWTREPAGAFQEWRMTWENMNHELRILGDGSEFVTGVTACCVIYHEGENRTIEFIFVLLL